MDAPLLTARIKNAKRFADVFELVDNNGATFNPIHCSAAWCCLGRVCGEREEVHRLAGFQRLLEITQECLARSGARELSNIVYGIAKSTHAAGQAREVFDEVAYKARRRLREFKSQEIANLAWAFAKAGHKAPELFDALGAEIPHRLREFPPQEVANVAWAFATADIPSEELFGSVRFVEACEEMSVVFGAAHLGQLHQWQVWADKVSRSWPRLPHQLRERCRETFNKIPFGR
jgi:hypothetical protein